MAKASRFLPPAMAFRQLHHSVLERQAVPGDQDVGEATGQVAGADRVTVEALDARGGAAASQGVVHQGAQHGAVGGIGIERRKGGHGSTPGRVEMSIT
ncbi:protein of unknown function (plasmid) [Candidatus Methylocalor cossyra]|uniref:Uncharacterized protein n=1 Tax=Candidatus Methylocalor cossyra TaxID=3108543 RepID=A0ABM9NMR5_9GAMM